MVTMIMRRAPGQGERIRDLALRGGEVRISYVEEEEEGYNNV